MSATDTYTCSACGATVRVIDQPSHLDGECGTDSTYTIPTADVHTIPATDIRPGDLVDTGDAVQPGPIVPVRQVATIDDVTHVLRREPGALIPDAYVFPADRHVAVHRAV